MIALVRLKALPANFFIIRQKKNICVFQVSAVKKLGMVGRH